MPLSLDEIVEETRQMPPDVVSELVDRIIAARHGGIAADIESAWKLEVQRRIEDIRSGKVQPIPLEEALARARKIAGL